MRQGAATLPLALGRGAWWTVRCFWLMLMSYFFNKFPFSKSNHLEMLFSSMRNRIEREAHVVYYRWLSPGSTGNVPPWHLHACAAGPALLASRTLTTCKLARRVRGRSQVLESSQSLFGECWVSTYKVPELSVPWSTGPCNHPIMPVLLLYYYYSSYFIDGLTWVKWLAQVHTDRKWQSC